MRRLLLVVVAVVAAGCRSAADHSAAPVTAPPAAAVTPAEPAAVPASALVDHLGDSTDTAVAVPVDAPDEGVPFEKDWIYDRFGKFRLVTAGMGQLNGRHYDVITVELPDGSTHQVFFDTTEKFQRGFK